MVGLLGPREALQMTYDDFLFRLRDPYFLMSYAKRAVLDWRNYLSQDEFSAISTEPVGILPNTPKS